MTMAKFIWSLHHLFHFKEFHVWLWELSVEDIRQMKAILFKSPGFEKCSVFVAPGIDMFIIEQEFDNALSEDPSPSNPCFRMTDFFKNNPTALRHCIRFDILQGISMRKAYSNICLVIGKEVIDYKNFELSFNQLSEGKFDKKKKEK
ncbi:unnamed protein product [Caenorhabditis brenneri]